MSGDIFRRASENMGLHHCRLSSSDKHNSTTTYNIYAYSMHSVILFRVIYFRYQASFTCYRVSTDVSPPRMVRWLTSSNMVRHQTALLMIRVMALAKQWQILYTPGDTYGAACKLLVLSIMGLILIRLLWRVFIIELNNAFV